MRRDELENLEFHTALGLIRGFARTRRGAEALASMTPEDGRAGLRRLHQLEAQLNELIGQMQQQRATMASLSGTAELAVSAPAVATSGSVINQVNAAELNGSVRAHTPWWVHLLYWLGIGGAVTWAIREHFWPGRRLAAAMAGAGSMPTGVELNAPVQARSAMPSIHSVSDAAAMTLDVAELPEVIDSLPSQAEESAPALLKTRDEPVDPSINAGVFVAFGRYAEAEKLLRAALQREPLRLDLKLQLLDVLMQSDQPAAFDELADAIEREATSPEMLAELAVIRDSYRRG